MAARAVPEPARRNAQRVDDGAFGRALPGRIRALPESMGVQRTDSEGAGDSGRGADGPYGGTLGQCDVLARSGARGDPEGQAGGGRTGPKAGAAVRCDPCGGGHAGEDLAGGWISGGGGIPEAVRHGAGVYWGRDQQPGGVSGVSKSAWSAAGGDQE